MPRRFMIFIALFAFFRIYSTDLDLLMEMLVTLTDSNENTGYSLLLFFL